MSWVSASIASTARRRRLQRDAAAQDLLVVVDQLDLEVEYACARHSSV